MKAIIYARVSSTTDRQNTARQIADLTKYAEYKGMEVVKTFEEKISGAKKNVWWMNPSDGSLSYVGELDNKQTEFTHDGAYLRGSDRVLIAVDAAKNYLQKEQKELAEKN